MFFHCLAQNPFFRFLITCLFLNTFHGMGLVMGPAGDGVMLSHCLLCHWVGTEEVTICCHQTGTQLPICCLQSTKHTIQPQQRHYRAAWVKKGRLIPKHLAAIVHSLFFSILKFSGKPVLLCTTLLLLWVWSLVNGEQIKMIVPITCFPWN